MSSCCVRTWAYFVCCAVDATYDDVAACQQMVRLFCNAQSCGRPTKDPNPNNILSKVVNGDFGDIEAWPWMASLQSVGGRLQVVGARQQLVGGRLQTTGARQQTAGAHLLMVLVPVGEQLNMRHFCAAASLVIEEVPSRRLSSTRNDVLMPLLCCRAVIYFVVPSSSVIVGC